MNLSGITAAVLASAGVMLAGCHTSATISSDTSRPPAISSNLVTGMEALVSTGSKETNWAAYTSIPNLRAAGEHGDAMADAFLGYMLIQGIRIPKDVEQGMRLLRRSADHGFAHAMAELGNMYLDGKVVPRDYAQALPWLKRAADLGESEAQRSLGACYQEGRGVETNYVLAATLYRRAADQTNYSAMKNLGVLYLKGLGVPADFEAARFWLLQAAEKGNNARAMFDLGLLAEIGATDTNRQAEAFKWYQRSADLDEPLGCYALANCYYFGKSVPVNFAKYVFWTSRAALGGHAEAQFFLGEAYRLGIGVSTNLDLAAMWNHRAATNNYPDAAYNIAVEFLNDKTNETARAEVGRYMLQAARLDHREAQFWYAISSFQGTNVTKDLELGKKWLMRAAEGGWAKAEYVLSQALMSGTPPFAKHEIGGQKWLERAASHGDFKAQDMLAIRLMKGFGVARDQAQAFRWWRWAAERGDLTAQNDLGYAIETAEEGQPDLVEACMWFQLAANSGVPQARVNLKRILGKLTALQYDEAKRRAGNFRALPPPKLIPVRRGDVIGTPLLKMSGDQ